MGLSLELPILKGSWEGSKEWVRGCIDQYLPSVNGRLQSTFPRDPKLQCPTLPGSPAPHANSHVGGGPAAGPPQIGAPGLGAWPITGPTCAAAAAGARPPVHPETPPARRTRALRAARTAQDRRAPAAQRSLLRLWTRSVGRPAPEARRQLP